MLLVVDSPPQNFKKIDTVFKSNSLNKLELLKRLQCERKTKKTPFSNSLLKKSCLQEKICQQVILRKSNNEYSSRRQFKLFDLKKSKFNKDKNYASAEQEHRNLQLIMQDSFKKSFKIIKKPILSHQTLQVERESRIRQVRSKTNVPIGHLRYKSDIQHFTKNYQNQKSNEKQTNKNFRRLIHSAIADRSHVKSLKNFSSINQFFKTNMASESILIQ